LAEHQQGSVSPFRKEDLVSQKLRLLLLSILLLIVSISIAAADPGRTIPQIVISATRSPADLSQIASSMTVITEEDIARKHKPSVAELLRTVPGMDINNSGGPGQTSRVFMRGTNSNHVLVLMDGVTLNDPSDPNDAFDFGNLTSDNIERIEVLRGAQSTLYGSQAIGGVINIISKTGKGTPRHHAFAEYGRYNSSKVGVGTSANINGLSYALEASNFHTSGISSMAKRFGGQEKDGTNIYTFSGNFANRSSDQFTGKLNLRYNRNRSQFDTPSNFSPRPHDDPYPENDTRQINGRLAGEYVGMNGKWIQELGLSRLTLQRSQITEFFDSIGTPFFGHQQYISWRDKLDWVHHVKTIEHHAFTFGTEFSSDHVVFHSSVLALSQSELNVDNQGIFFDDQFTYGDFFLNAGIRSDIHQSFGRKSTWKVAPGYNFPKSGTRIKASYGTGFKAPSLFSLYDRTFGTATLHPETSKSYDAGFEQALWKDRVVFGATVFRNDINDLLDTVFVPPSDFRYTNIGKARTQGVETSLSINPAVDWKITSTYTFTQADDRSADKRLKRRPKHIIGGEVQWQYSQEGDVGFTVRHVGVSFDSDFSFAAANTKPFTTIDLYTNYRVNETASVYARVDNLLDRRYEEVYGYGEPGMSLIGGVKAGF
jgi:vitamin B12 transporter